MRPLFKILRVPHREPPKAIRQALPEPHHPIKRADLSSPSTRNEESLLNNEQSDAKRQGHVPRNLP